MIRAANFLAPDPPVLPARFRIPLQNPTALQDTELGITLRFATKWDTHQAAHIIAHLISASHQERVEPAAPC